MQSIPATMTWELLARGRWHLILATLVAIAMPSFFLLALRGIGYIDPQDNSLLVINIIMMFLYISLFGTTLASVQGTISRLYALPIRTGAIVGWRLLSGMIVIALQMVVSIGLLNVLFDVDWPIWGPMLAAAATLATLQSLVWLTDKSVAWLIIFLTVVGTVVGGWFRWRYGPLFSEPGHYWRVVTPVELLTMLATVLAAYWLGVKAVARNRRGEPPLSLGIVDSIYRLLERAPASDRPIRNGYQAQCWFEWRRKGWVMPAAAVMATCGGVIGWVIGSREPEHLFFGFVVGNAFLYIFALMGGVVFGNTGPNDANYRMGQFLATRPISDVEMARAILHTATKSIYLACLVWASAFLIVCAGLAAFGATKAMQMPDDPYWWQRLLLTLVAPWTLMATLLCIGLSGYAKHATILACSAMAVFVGGLLASSYLLTNDSQLLLGRANLFVVATTIILGTIGTYVASRRRGLIPPATAWTAVIVWSAATLMSVAYWPTALEPSVLGYFIVAAGVGLSIAPFAAAPLALSANRHR